MKLKKYALIAETVGGLAIVLSMFFVGYELQQSNKTSIQTATQAVVSDYAAALRTLSEDGQLACIYSRGMQDFNALSGSERVRFSAWMLSVFIVVQEMHLSYRLGGMDESSWNGFKSIIEEIIQLPGTQQWLEIRRHWFGDDFREFLDEMVASSSTINPIIYDDPACSPAIGN